MPNEYRLVDKDFKLWVFTHDIPDILEKYKDAYDFYFKYRVLGDPFMCGWNNWPCVAYDIIMTLRLLEKDNHG